MKNWLAFILILSSVSVTAQVTEDFETGTKSSYALATVTLTSGVWSFNDALIGSTASDRFTGTKGVRLRNGYISMDFNTSNAGTVTLKHAKYGSDANSTWKLQKSTDNGANWIDVGSPVTTTSTTLTEAVFLVNEANPVRFRVQRTDGTTTRIGVDDFAVTTFGTDAAPVISDLTQPNSTNLPAEDADFNVSASVSDNNSVSSVSLLYTISGGVTDTLPMTNVTGSVYSATISESKYSNGSLVKYWVIALDDASQKALSPESKFFAGTTPISAVRQNDANGLNLNNGVLVRVTGTASMTNGTLGGANMDWYLQDATGGLNVFKFNDAAFATTIGVSYTVTGTLTAFNGRLEIVPAVTDDIISNGQGTILPLPHEVLSGSVSSFNTSAESFEGKLVSLKNLNYVSGAWPATDTLKTIIVSDDGGTSQLSLSLNVNNAPANVPAGKFDIFGIVRQNDNSSPFTGSYSIVTRSAQDFEVFDLPDVTKPTITSVVVNSDSILTITFSEPMDSSSVVSLSNYSINNNAEVDSVFWANSVPEEVVLKLKTLAFGFYTLTVNNVADTAGNVIVENSAFEFEWLDAGAPSLVNATALTDSTVSVFFSEKMDSLSLTIKENYIISNGVTVNSVTVNSSTIDNVELSVSKMADGDYTLMVENVTDSSGVPIAVNSSVMFNWKAPFIDTTPPQLIQHAVVNDSTISLLFNESMDSLSADVSNFSIDNNIAVLKAHWSSSNPSVIKLITQKLVDGTYNLTITGVQDSSGNVIANNILVVFEYKSYPFQYIGDVRNQPLGTIVTVSGRVTVANEFGGPIFFQDKTGGLACYEVPLHTAVAIGDSVIVTGPLAEFGAAAGQVGTGLLQISGTGVTFQVFKQNPKLVPPKQVTLAQIGEVLEGQLIVIRNVTIAATGTFAQNKNYDISDATASLIEGIRIDNNTNLVGANAPTKAVDLIGVVSQNMQFGKGYQIQPRFANDLGLNAFVVPYENIPADSTLDVITWNTEWLGSSVGGPADDALQVQNVIRVLKTIKADIYGLQEMSSSAAFQTILDSLPDYGGAVAPINQTQKTAFLYKKSSINLISNGFLFTSGDWATGRYPFEMVVDYKRNSRITRLHLINIHAKATVNDPPDDYARRVADASQLYDFLNANRADSKLILLGDFNDDLDFSTYGTSNPSPYASFVSDAARYRPISKFLSDRGISSGSGANPIDHMVITNELVPVYLDSTIRIENVSYIGSYLSTTSDHYPVKARFKINDGTIVSVGENGKKADQFEIYGNYPNPFNPSTTFRFNAPDNGHVRIEIYNIIGQKIKTVFDSNLSKGYQEVGFNAASLTSGVYYYKIYFNDSVKTGKLTLMK